MYWGEALIYDFLCYTCFMASFKEDGSLNGLQKLIGEIYGLPDDRLYSIWDLLTQEQRFAMRALKGIRKGNKEKVMINLLISLSWLLAIANRLHIDIEDETWKRFPMLCSYCGKIPCACRKIKSSERKKVRAGNAIRPKTLSEYQKMFTFIYPPGTRTLTDAGVHFAEEVGEVSEAIHNFLGQHKRKQFYEVKIEMADLISCVFGMANSAKISVAKEFTKIYHNNCHTCHKLPCVCSFSAVAKIKT